MRKRLREAMNSLRFKFTMVAVMELLAIIVILFIVNLIAGRIYSRAMAYENMAVQTDTLMNIVDEMYTDISDYAILDMEESIDDFHDKIEYYKLYFSNYSEQEGDYWLIYRNLYQLTIYFESVAEDIIEDHDEGVPTSILRSRMQNLQDAKEYIDSELLDLLKLQTNDSAEELSEVNRVIRHYRAYSVIILLTGGCLILLIADRMTRRIFHIMKDLNEYTLQIGNGIYEEFDVDKNVPTEIYNLVDAYNKMSISVREVVSTAEKNTLLANLLKEEEIANVHLETLLRDAELNLLRSQINPHFLFNTLSVAMAMAEEERADGVHDMLLHLTSILRASLGSSNRKIRLKEEVELVEHYLSIQNIRFGDRLSVEKYVDANTEDVMIPALIMQPFIENAISHGLLPKKDGGVLGFFVFIHGDDVIIHIRDNGVGMSKEVLQGIMDYDKPSSQANKHGIGNVMRRLQLLYGENKVNITSTEGGGTNIRIMIPIDGI